MSETTEQVASDLNGRASNPNRAARTFAAAAGVLGFLSGLPQFGPSDAVLFSGPAHAEAGEPEAQRAIITVRDASGVKGELVPLSIQVDAPSAEGPKVNVHIGDLPKGARLTDGSHSALAADERDLIDVTGWDLSHTTFSMPSDATGQFTLALVAVVENAVRPLLTQASFVTADRAALPTGPVRTVQADVNPDQIAVRTTQEPDPAREAAVGSTGSGSAEGSGSADQQIWREAGSARAPIAPARPAPRDPVAEALANDRKSWLERERIRTNALTSQLTAAHQEIGELKSKMNTSPERLVDTPIGRAEGDARTSPLKEVGVARLLSKAEELIKRGDVSSARSLLERALETGSHEAAVLPSPNLRCSLPAVLARARHQPRPR